jgi:hypothetical protein
MDYSIKQLMGKTIRAIEVLNDEIKFATDDGLFRMFHDQDCCEGVELDDVCGDWDDLIGTPVLQAEENSNSDQGAKGDYDESYTWTFYKLATIKGGVTIRWYGSSNGYYSESVEVVRIAP